MEHMEEGGLRVERGGGYRGWRDGVEGCVCQLCYGNVTMLCG